MKVLLFPLSDFSFIYGCSSSFIAERIKDLESQLQAIATRNNEDKVESEKQSQDAKAAVAARDELQGTPPLFSFIILSRFSPPLLTFNSLERIQQLQTHEAALLNEIQTLKKEAESAQKNYQHELVAHAADVQRLDSTEKELAVIKAQLVEVKAKTMAEKQGYESREESWRDTQQHLLQQVKELEERLAALKGENESLHNVAESMLSISNKLQQQCIQRRGEKITFF
jgi:TPR/MLP1/MLP2-like protein